MYPRTLAIRILTRVLSDHESLDEALAAVSGEVDSSGRGWLQEVCAGTLRWKGRLDWIVDSIALRKKPSGWLRKALLIAAYQLVAQERTSPGAVVSETVSEIKKREGEAPAKFANALLRKVADHAVEWRNLPLPTGSSDEEAAAWASLPLWLWKRLVRDHGREWATAFSLAALERPKLWVAAHDLNWHPERANAGTVEKSWEMSDGGGVTGRAGFDDGQFIVQDISSQLLIQEITKKVADAEGGLAQLKALDLCAAPGGKSVGLCWKGFSVTASDISERRLELLRSTVQRAAPAIRVLESSAVDALELQDFVWVDSPCSGTGIVRRHPDVRWLRRENEMAKLLVTQDEVLKKGWSKVRPGGWLVYSVCSVLKDEGPGAIARAALQGNVVESWFLAPHLAPFGDGFWAALLRKK